MRHFYISVLLAVVLPASVSAQIQTIDRLCIIDEETFDETFLVWQELAADGICGNGEASRCINDQFADPGVRLPLPIPIGTIIGNGVLGGTVNPLLTGEIEDEGMFFLLAEDAPESWTTAGPTTDPLLNFLLASADWFGNDSEHLMDKIPNVTPMHTAHLEAMIGETCCAIVYDSSVSINYDPLNGNLQGATLGVVAFTLLDVGPDPAGSVLPDITIRIEDPTSCLAPPTTVEATSWGRIKNLYR